MSLISPRPNIVCLVIDGWQAGYVGAYGNTQVATPGIDRIAARGVVFDQALIESPRLADIYRAYWLGRGAGRPANADAPSLMTRLAANGYRTVLISDEADVFQFPGGDGANKVEVPYSPAKRSVRDLEHSQSARFFRAVGECLVGQEDSGPLFVWAHARGLCGDWDAPYFFREETADEDDPPPPRDVRFAPRLLADDADPDELLGIRAAYAAQVRLIDGLLEILDDMADATANAHGIETVLIVTSPRGYPLGEHRRLGFASDPSWENALHEELVHVPLLIRTPRDEMAAARSNRLVRQADLYPTILALAGIDASPPWNTGDMLMGLDDGGAPWRDHIFIGGDNEAAIRTPDWHLRRAAGATLLFVKPDDRWEVNDVAARCPAQAEGLAAAIDAYRRAEASETPLAPLSEELRTPC